MTATIPTQRHPGEDDPTFLSVNACSSCGALTATCIDPGCVRWGNTVDKLQDRSEDWT